MSTHIQRHHAGAPMNTWRPEPRDPRLALSRILSPTTRGHCIPTLASTNVPNDRPIDIPIRASTPVSGYSDGFHYAAGAEFHAAPVAYSTATDFRTAAVSHPVPVSKTAPGHKIAPGYHTAAEPHAAPAYYTAPTTVPAYHTATAAYTAANPHNLAGFHATASHTVASSHAAVGPHTAAVVPSANVVPAPRVLAEPTIPSSANSQPAPRLIPGTSASASATRSPAPRVYTFVTETTVPSASHPDQPRIVSAGSRAKPAPTSEAAGHANKVTKKRTESRFDWSNYKETIRELYIDEGRTLNDVIEILKDEYGFTASERMIKGRMKEWGYLKNVRIKDAEVQPLLDMISEAMSQGNSSDIAKDVKLSTGRVLSLDKVAAHLKRKRLPKRIHDLSLARYQASIPSPSALQVNSPATFRIPEAFFSDVKRYIQGMRVTIGNSKDTLVSSSVSGPARSLLNQAIMAGKYFARKQPAKAINLLQEAPDHVKGMLQDDTRAILRTILTLVCVLLHPSGSEGLKRTVKSLLVFTAEAMSETHHNRNFLHRILVAYSRMEEDVLFEVALRGLECLLTTYESQIYPSIEPSTMPAWLDLGEATGSSVLHFTNLERLAIRSYETQRDHFGEMDRRTVPYLFLIAELERQKGLVYNLSTNRLRNLVVQILDNCERIQGPRLLVVEYNCNHYLAEIYRLEGNHMLAVRHMGMAVQRCFERGDNEVAEFYKSELQRWRQELGAQTI